MGKRRRRNNRNRFEESTNPSVDTSVDTPKTEPPKPPTFKIILEKSRGTDESSSCSNRTNDDNNTGQPSSDCRHKPTPKEYQPPIPRVQSNREWRLANRRNDPYHYTLWRNAYDSYLWILFDGTQNILNLFKVHLEEEISFETFAFFIYEFSSGYISPYA